MVKSIKVANSPMKSRQWMVDKLNTLKASSPSKLITDSAREKSTFAIGKMFFFVYDAKGKDDLPYWDRFPLVFPIEVQGDGFLGINLHYLPPNLRAILIDKLMEVANNKKFDDTTKLRLSYGLLSRTKKFKEFRPCIKKYLSDHIRTKFIQVEAYEWHQAILLPFHQFEGASAEKVYKDSRKKIANV